VIVADGTGLVASSGKRSSSGADADDAISLAINSFGIARVIRRGRRVHVD